MELKKSFDLRVFFGKLYFILAVAFLAIGFLPAEAATEYEILGKLEIPIIGLTTEVAKLELDNGELKTPKDIAGVFSQRENKTLIIGHASTVFDGLDGVSIGDYIIYGEKEYVVVKKEIILKEEIRMSRILKGENVDTLVIMTCAGEDLGDGDATHRLMLTAKVL